jgi:hypothetical protein
MFHHAFVVSKRSFQQFFLTDSFRLLLRSLITTGTSNVFSYIHKYCPKSAHKRKRKETGGKAATKLLSHNKHQLRDDNSHVIKLNRVVRA